MGWPKFTKLNRKLPSEGTLCKVYDIETKTIIKEFDSYSAASMYLGITPQHVGQAIRGKHKTFSPFLNKRVAIRNNHKTN